jgi:hypothetical protein
VTVSIRPRTNLLSFSGLDPLRILLKQPGIRTHIFESFTYRLIYYLEKFLQYQLNWRLGGPHSRREIIFAQARNGTPILRSHCNMCKQMIISIFLLISTVTVSEA